MNYNNEYQPPVVGEESYLCYYYKDVMVGRAYCELGWHASFSEIREAIRSSHNHLLQLKEFDNSFWKMTSYFPKYDFVMFYNIKINRFFFKSMIDEYLSDDDFFSIFKSD